MQDERARLLGPHEAMEVHEALNFKTICAAKSKGMAGMVVDRDLKALMEQDLQQSLKHMNELENLLSRAKLQ
ncbi:spore coat protein [Alicyclobacillus dauci]|uniref:Spore coat protein n=1 Tax=Alicyclobacillus dauci TaxID=1475485 RepID=A0ABY6Z9C3_9BACL|nr:spore coat protein [Alicyclobacillus dauci]WAH39454.1 spore coat protein [Alicyclobacillus dauci]